MPEAREVAELYDRDRPQADSLTIADRLIWAHQHPPPEDYDCESGAPEWNEIYRDGKLHIGDEEFQIACDDLAVKRDESRLSILEYIQLCAFLLVLGFVLGVVLR